MSGKIVRPIKQFLLFKQWMVSYKHAQAWTHMFIYSLQNLSNPEILAHPTFYLKTPQKLNESLGSPYIVYSGLKLLSLPVSARSVMEFWTCTIDWPYFKFNPLIIQVTTLDIVARASVCSTQETDRRFIISSKRKT